MKHNNLDISYFFHFCRKLKIAALRFDDCLQDKIAIITSHDKLLLAFSAAVLPPWSRAAFQIQFSFLISFEIRTLVISRRNFLLSRLRFAYGESLFLHIRRSTPMELLISFNDPPVYGILKIIF